MTKAVHLDVMLDMSAQQFLLGLHRFIARHGKPNKVIYDNASHFNLAAESVDKF